MVDFKKKYFFIFMMMTFSCFLALLTYSEEHYVLNSSSVVENNLEALLRSDNLNLHAMDELTYELVFSKDIPRLTKIDIFMRQLTMYHQEPIRFGYLSDVFMSLKPIEKTLDFIRGIKEEKLAEVRLNYLELLIASVASGSAQQFYDERAQAKKFLIQIIQRQSDGDLMRVTMINYPEIFMDNQTYEMIVKRLSSLKQSDPTTFSKIVTNSNFWYHSLSMAAKNNDSQEVWVEKLFELSKEYAGEISFRQKSLDQHTEKLQRVPSVLRAFHSAFIARTKKDKALRISPPLQRRIEMDRQNEEKLRPARMTVLLDRLKSDYAAAGRKLEIPESKFR